MIELPKIAGQEMGRIYKVDATGALVVLKQKSAIEEAIKTPNAVYIRGIKKDHVVPLAEVLETKEHLSRKSRKALEDVVDIFDTLGIETELTDRLHQVMAIA